MCVLLIARLFPSCVLRDSGTPRGGALSCSSSPLWGQLANVLLAALPQRRSIIINSACQASSQFGSYLLSIWKGWASSLILELSRSSAVWPEDKPSQRARGRAKERARASRSLNHGGNRWEKEGKCKSKLCVFAEHRAHSRGKQENSLWFSGPGSRPRARHRLPESI